MLAYGTYSLWDTYRVSQNAFVSAELLDYKPGGAGESAGFAELQELNPDVRAWITIPDTHIDYPVLQGENDMIYVNQDVYGEFSLSGAIRSFHEIPFTRCEILICSKRSGIPNISFATALW